MEDDEITLTNACTDLVSLRASEAFPRHLLTNVRPGEWIDVRRACQQVGVAPGELTTDVFATWLPDPVNVEAYAVILFFDDESKWSMAAHYNRGRLQGGALADNANKLIAMTFTVSSDTTVRQPAPAAER